MTAQTFAAGRYHTGLAWVAVLYREGRTRLHMVSYDGTVRHHAAPLTDARYMVPLLWRGAPYPVARMVRKFTALGRTAGITAAAKAELKRARADVDITQRGPPDLDLTPTGVGRRQ